MTTRPKAPPPRGPGAFHILPTRAVPPLDDIGGLAFWLNPQWTGRDNLRDPGTEPFWMRAPANLVVERPVRIPCPDCGAEQTRAPYYGFWCCSVCDWEADSYAPPTPPYQ